MTALETALNKDLAEVHLRTIAAGGYPRGEHVDATVQTSPAHTGAGVATWQWNGVRKTHAITLYSGMAHHLAPGALDHGRARKRAVYQLYQHERGHALFTERNPAATRAALIAAKVPFVIANALEDCRIEFKMNKLTGVKFAWGGIFPAMDTSVPAWDRPGYYAIFPFILSCKLALNKCPRRLSTFSGVRDAMRKHLFTADSVTGQIPWAPVSVAHGITPERAVDEALGFQPFLPLGYTGTLRHMTASIMRYVWSDDNFAGRIATFAKTWRGDGLPLPAAHEAPPEDLPATPGGASEGEGDLGLGNEPSPATAPDASETAAPSELEPIRDVTGLKESDPSEREGKSRDNGKATKHSDNRVALGPMKSARPADPPKISYGTKNSLGHNYDPAGYLEDNAWDYDGDQCAKILGTAFPGISHAWSSDPGGAVDIDRYLDRTPEMFRRPVRGYGKRGDVILVVDGSGSMNEAWRQYGIGITAGLIRLRRAGALKRLRILLTYGSGLRDFGDVTDLELPRRINCHASTEGLWAAYEHIAGTGMIDSPDVQVLVLTDGDITDTHPSLPLAHAAGCYPVGIFVGEHRKAEAVRAFFDQFIARPDRLQVLDEVARLF